MRKKTNPTPATEVSVIEREVPATKIEKTIKLSIKGQEFELTFDEANAIAAAIDGATGRKPKQEKGLLEDFQDALRRRDRQRIPFEPPFIQPRPYYGPDRSPSIAPNYPPGTITCSKVVDQGSHMSRFQAH